jgi:hypothetical protein
MSTLVILKKTIVIAFLHLQLSVAFLILSEVGVFQNIDCLFVSRSIFQFHEKSQIDMLLSILVTNPAEQHNIVILKQAQRQTIGYREMSPVSLDS